MLRGFRWQLIALVAAAALFTVGVLTSQQPSVPDSPAPAPTATATTLPASPTSPPTAPAPVVPLPASDSEDVPTFREAVVGPVTRLNPLLESNPAEADIASLIFEGLTRTNEFGEPEPALAASWIISTDNLEYVVRLREDVLWQDGTPFTSRDVAFTMALLRSPDFPGPDELGAFWRTVETQVLDEHLVRFRLTQPLGNFLDALRIGILPEHALIGTAAADLPTHPFNLAPIGTGPYQLEALRTTDGQRISVVDLRVAPVFRQRPEGQSGYNIERMRFQVYDTFDAAQAALVDDSIDAVAAPTQRQRRSLLNIDGTNVYTKIDPTLGVLIFNWQRPEEGEPLNPFREERVRDALEIGLNRGSIIERHLLNQAVPADNPLMPGSWAYAPDLVWPQSSVEQARQLLETANLAVQINETTNETEDSEETPASESDTSLLTFTILTPSDPALVAVAEEMSAQWSQLNVVANVDAVDTAAYRERLESGAFDTAIVELSLGDSADPDVYSFWHQGQFPDGENFGAIDDRRISETLERARRDPNGLHRKTYYREFQEEFINRTIAIPLYYPLYTYAVSERVDGVQLGFVGSPTDRFRNLQQWNVAPPS